MTADVVRDMNALAEATDSAIKGAVDGIDLSEIEQVGNRLTDHLEDNMPHSFMDGIKKIKYGFKTNVTKDGLIFVFEEVL